MGWRGENQREDDNAIKMRAEMRGATSKAARELARLDQISHLLCNRRPNLLANGHT
jgi:hypothetical protein